MLEYSFWGFRIPFWKIVYPIRHSFDDRSNVSKWWVFSFPVAEINWMEGIQLFSHSPLNEECIPAHGFQLKDPDNPLFMSREHIIQLIQSIHTIKRFIPLKILNTEFKLVQYEWTLPLDIRNIERETLKIWIGYIPCFRVDSYKIQNTLSKAYKYKTIFSLYHNEIET